MYFSTRRAMDGLMAVTPFTDNNLDDRQAKFIHDSGCGFG